MMKFVALIAVIFVVGVSANAINDPVPSPHVRCDALPKAKLSSRYHESIAHAIHSMDLAALRKFDPTADEENNIPTVNENLKSPEKVLDHTPNVAMTNDFDTDSMNLVDRVLSRVGVSDDGLGQNWTPLERVVHNFHMQDLWSKIKPVHGNLTGLDQSVCKCLLNTQSNGIRSAVEWVARHYAKGTPITLLNRPIPELKDAETWKVWKARLLHYYTPEALHDAAYFLRCQSAKFAI